MATLELSEQTEMEIPLCSGCGKPLEDIVEKFSGVQNWYWNKEKQCFSSDWSDKNEDPEELSCFHCGQPLSEEQREFFGDNKE